MKAYLTKRSVEKFCPICNTPHVLPCFTESYAALYPSLVKLSYKGKDPVFV